MEVLDSEIPEEIIMAILADYEKVDTQEVIEKIIGKLQHATKSESELRRAIEQLLMLSRLRKLESEINQKVKKMPITYDYSTDGLYLLGQEEKLYQMVKKALIKQEFTPEQISAMMEVSIEYVLSVKSEIGKG